MEVVVYEEDRIVTSGTGAYACMCSGRCDRRISGIKAVSSGQGRGKRRKDRKAEDQDKRLYDQVRQGYHGQVKSGNGERKQKGDQDQGRICREGKAHGQDQSKEVIKGKDLQADSKGHSS